MTSSSEITAVSERSAVGFNPRRPRGPGAPQFNRRRTKVGRAPLWLLTPTGIVMIALIVVPIVFLIVTSFTNFNQRTLFTGAFQWVGLKQYAAIFTSIDFWWALLRTVAFTAVMVAGSVFIGMGVAQLLTRLATGMRYVVTVVLILAWAMPNVASSQVWKWLFEPGFGVINWLLTKLHIFGDVINANWPQNSSLAFLCIWLLIVWQAVPFIALTLYAAQSQVGQEYIEAARLDGANDWRIYWNVTIPFLRPTLMLMTILSVIWDFNVFNQIWLISQGGPNDATNTLGVYTYTSAFVSFNLGGGAAIAIVTTILLMIFTAFYIRSLLRSGEDL
jgi:N,N'-diacetylchitobiose transport system permease protein